MDYLIKALALDDQVRVYISRTTNIANEAQTRHDLWPSALSILSKTMTITSLMGATLEKKQSIAVKLTTNGPIGNVYTESDATGHVRGYVSNPHISYINHNEKTLNDEYPLGSEGHIQVIKDLKLKNLFTSQVPLTYFDLAKDFAYYLNASEQTPTAVSLGILINEENRAINAGGLMVQLLPDTSEEVITFLEDRLSEIPTMSNLLKEYSTLEEILDYIFTGNYRVLTSEPIAFECTCSKERFSVGIKSLGSDEIDEIIAENEEIETLCHFCGEKYYFTVDELISLNKNKL